MRLSSVLTSLLVWAGLIAGYPTLTWADEPELEEQRVEQAISKGLEWLRGQQSADGSYDGGYLSQFPLGPTALVALTLEKAGPEDDPTLEKAWRYLLQGQLRRTYGAGILLMALEARYAPSPAQQLEGKDPYKTLVRKRFRGGRKVDKQQAQSAANWLLRTRHRPLWGYPFGGSGDAFPGGNEWDHSNTQYALLGLGAASRLGFKPDAGALLEALEQLLAGQEQAGPDVESFFVPAADAPFKDLDQLAKDLAVARAKAADGKPDETVSRVRRFYETFEPHSMRARGWAYFPVGTPGAGPANSHPAAQSPPMYRAGVSMTAACLASTIVLKSLLEKSKPYKRNFRDRVDQAIRDGAAFLARNWTLEEGMHPYYYLYGLERVGVLTGCQRFGEHYWYHEGGGKILDDQNQDGSWGSSSPVQNGGLAQVPNAIPQTCFAILFLSRATVPLVPKMPERPRTGGR